MAIKFYRIPDNFGFCSNFARTKIFIYGHWWETVEHAYQAMKTLNVADQDAIRKAKTPKEARELGQTVQLRPDFDKVKDTIMKECVLAKFVQHQDLMMRLFSSDDEELIEDSPVDWYWGCGKDGTGKNMLGKILMEVREELRNG